MEDADAAFNGGSKAARRVEVGVEDLQPFRRALELFEPTQMSEVFKEELELKNGDLSSIQRGVLRVKHVDYHFIRERVTSGLLQIRLISTQDQIANVFTKGLSRSQFSKLLSKLHISPQMPSLRGNVKH
ncbi:hypothetical protein H6P81_016741 [Aristolochia fimbriata]|uniref:Uncharacterized protein n=1 Tax=Aristolochia fimbriata TaxID=158543 RepID=A0AAV7EAF0_ARIFI|nr:hypothetical protein H6P81_016741 [Aristolochia fimbriata]